MRQLPRILLLAVATVIVIVALLISGLRLVMPHLNSYRADILSKVSAVSGLPMSASEIQGSWQNFGPTLEVSDLAVELKDGGKLTIDRVTLALDVWQSLLHARWQFRDLTFWQMHLTTNSPLVENDDNRTSLKADQLSDLFLRQFDHFDLRDSSISFLTPSGQRAELAIPKLTWLNQATRHRAEGEVSLSSFTGQHGVVQVRLDLSDNNGLLNNGRIWMQADDVDVKPWLGQWMRDNVSLDSARFSLAAWLSLEQGEVYAGDVWLKKGGADWHGDQRDHRLEVDNLTAHMARVNNGWSLTVPQTRLKTDGVTWPQGQFSLLWQPEDSAQPGPDRTAEWRVRATQLDLQNLEPFIPLFSRLAPQLLENWRALQPRGQLDALALDVPVKQPEKTRFQAQWRNLSWQPWQLLPGMEHFDGKLSGSVAQGRLDLQLNNATLPYSSMFRAPLEVHHASGAINWQYGDDGLTLSGRDLDVQARSLWLNGDFRYSQLKHEAPRLDLLAGIHLDDAAEAWRYFPEPLMGRETAHYLTGALKGGQVDNATLIFAGDPLQFPFRHNEGIFEVWVPLRHAEYAFQPGWPTLKDLAIDLDFVNNGLWMNAPETQLGNVQGKNITAVIPDYLEEKLIIDGDIRGAGPDVRSYFNQTPLKSSLGAALDELQIGGDVSGRLHLDIPLDGKRVRASGEVGLNNNSLLIKPLGTTLKQLTGRFRYDNGTLQSDEMSANWFGQPLGVSFSTVEGEKEYQVGVNLKGNWRPSAISGVPEALAEKLEGSAAWNGNVAVTLPHSGGASYKVDINGDLQNVSSHLPSPLNKDAGSALPFSVSASGDQKSFDLSGVLDKTHRFNTRWLLGDRVQVERGIWLNDAQSTPALPEASGMVLNLPPLDGEAWLGLLAGSSEAQAGSGYLPGNIILRTPSLTLAGQQWRDLEATISENVSGSTMIQAQGREVRGTLTMPQHAAWRARFSYLYYNPQFAAGSGNKADSPFPAESTTIDFSRWPQLAITCDECWLRGQKFGRIQADLTPANDTLTLKNGLIDSGNARLTVNGEWINRPAEQRTSLKGQLSGKNINDAANWFGVNTPLRDAPFTLDYDLHWRSAPWQPSEETLSGVLKSHLGKGQVTDISTGRAGQLLRLVSFDSLLRKLRLDFSDTFSQGFWFDSINGTAWIENGVMQTDNLLVDGLEADIAMQGKVDLVQRRIDMEAVVAPEISATVGVGVAFVVNPVVGAAVFAASKVLGPLWNKISVLRYHISGPIDKPEINEVLRKPRENSAK